MRFYHVLLGLGLLVVGAATAAEITTDDEKVIKDCDIVSVTAKEVTYKVGEKEVTRPVKEIVRIDFRDPDKIASDKKYSQVELTDGTVLLVSQWSIKGDELEMTLLSGPTVKMSVEQVNGILNTAHDDKDRNDWRNRIINTRGKEAVVIKKIVMRTDKETKKEVPALDENGKPQTTTFNLESGIGKGDEKGETIAIAVPDEDSKNKVKEVQMKQREIHGLIWKHSLDVNAAPVNCKLTDTSGNAIMAAKVEGKKDGVAVTTQCGAKLEFTNAQISQIDYTKGRLDYLSVMLPKETNPKPLDPEESPKEKKYVYRDTNLQDKPIKLGGTSFRYGLTLLPDVELVYALNGGYRQFEAVIGLDDETNAQGDAVVEIWGDNRKLKTIKMPYRSEKDDKGAEIKPLKPHEKVSLSVKDVETLKIIFKASSRTNGLSMHASLGDVKVTRQ